MFTNSPLPAALQLVQIASVQAWRLASANRQLNDIEPREEQLTASGSLSHPSTHICLRCFVSLGFGVGTDILSSSGRTSGLGSEFALGSAHARTCASSGLQQVEELGFDEHASYRDLRHWSTDVKFRLPSVESRQWTSWAGSMVRWRLLLHTTDSCRSSGTSGAVYMMYHRPIHWSNLEG